MICKTNIQRTLRGSRKVENGLLPASRFVVIAGVGIASRAGLRLKVPPYPVRRHFLRHHARQGKLRICLTTAGKMYII